MANRSHLYVFDRFEAGLPSKPRGLHEWGGSIPVSHRVLMSGRPRRYTSSIFPGRVAVVADYEPGMNRFVAFLRALVASRALPDEFTSEVRATDAFLEQDHVKGRLLLLEPAEVFALHPAVSAEVQCARLVDSEIPKLAAQVDALLAKPPEKLFARAPSWLDAVRADSGASELGISGFASDLFYALDRTDRPPLS